MQWLSSFFCLADASLPPGVDLLENLTALQKILVSGYGILVIAGFILDGPAFYAWYKSPKKWQRGVEQLHYRPWDRVGLFRVAFFILMAFLVSYTLGLVLNHFFKGFLDEHPEYWVLFQSVVLHLPVIFYLGYSLKKRSVSWDQAFGLSLKELSRGLKVGFLFYLGVLPIMLFYTWLYSAFLNYIGYEAPPQEIARIIAGGQGWFIQAALLLVAGAVAPLFEELIFRGVALPVFVKRWGLTRGVLLISVCFAIIHFNVASVVPLFVLAVGLCLAYIYSGSIVAPLVMHGVFNGVNVIMMTQVPELVFGTR